MRPTYLSLCFRGVEDRLISLRELQLLNLDVGHLSVLFFGCTPIILVTVLVVTALIVTPVLAVRVAVVLGVATMPLGVFAAKRGHTSASN